MSSIDIFDLITKAANATKLDVGTNVAYNYQDHRHNQYKNAFSRRLHEELRSRNMPFEKEPDLTHNGRTYKPDFVIKNRAVVEVKAKASGFNVHDRNEQIQTYKIITGLPVYAVNFGTDGSPNVRKF